MRLPHKRIVSITLDPELVARVDRVAEAYRVSRSWLIDSALRAYLDAAPSERADMPAGEAMS